MTKVILDMSRQGSKVFSHFKTGVRFIDEKLVDGPVVLVGLTIKGLNLIFRTLQSGKIQFYMMVILLFIALVYEMIVKGMF